MEKREFRMISFYIFAICLSAIFLVLLVPQSGQVVTLMLTLPSLIMWGAWAIMRKVDGE